jgi:hypothetical protein
MPARLRGGSSKEVTIMKIFLASAAGAIGKRLMPLLLDA